MSSSRLTLFFSGTQMTWESMATLLSLGATRRDNLDVDAKEGEHRYYFFDGPAAPVSKEHLPVEHLYFDKKSGKPHASNERSMMNSVGFAYRFGRGGGTDHLVYTAYNMLLDQIRNKKIRKIDLVGFSRGAHVALLVGCLLNRLRGDIGDVLTKKEWSDIAVNIFAIDPVAGITRNHEAKKFGNMSPHVKLCVVGLATNESLPGFDQRDILSDTERYNLKFHPVTKYIFLPFPEDHMMCLFWMRDMIRSHIPIHSPLLNPPDHDHHILRVLGKKDVKWEDYDDHTFAFRLVKYVDNKERYNRRLISYANCNFFALQVAIETCFKYLEVQQGNNVGHVSLQNEADSQEEREYKGHVIGGKQVSTKSLQEFFAGNADNFIFKLFDSGSRVCKRKLTQYTNALFINLFHEAMFKIAYRELYDYIALGCLSRFKNLALKELQGISMKDFPHTYNCVANVVNTSKKIGFTPLRKFEVTNIESFEGIFVLLTNSTQIPVKQNVNANIFQDEKQAVIVSDAKVPAMALTQLTAKK